METKKYREAEKNEDLGKRGRRDGNKVKAAEVGRSRSKK